MSIPKDSPFYSPKMDATIQALVDGRLPQYTKAELNLECMQQFIKLRGGLMNEHPTFTRAKELDEPLRSHFPHSSEECAEWKPMIAMHQVGGSIIAVARTRIECAWAAYIGCTHSYAYGADVQGPPIERILAYGDKLGEDLARHLFPQFKDVPYAH